PPSPKQQRAILRLQAYKPPKTSYDSMPLSRRAAVLVLLFPDIHGRLRVVLTLRSERLRNFAGQVALPGGKADTLTETPEDTARREAYEEIGLPLPNHNFQIRFSVTHLTELPCHLSQNNLAVRPVVAVLLPAVNKLDIPIDLESLLIPHLDPKEVSAVFSTPLEAFLAKTYPREYTKPPTPTPGEWYKGKLQNWNGRDWYMHEFMAPVWAHKAEVLMHYRVWGMTARILIDVARIAYEKEPEFECLEEKGDEDMIAGLWDHGMLKGERKHG
ncbi:NUDIX hydrolase domain-like protein, partial [Terfezia claveryi]